MIAGFTLTAIGLALAAALAAGFVRGLAGFGMAILLVPVLALAVPPAEAVVIANVLGLLIGLPELRMMARDSESSARGIALLAVLFTPLGMMALAAIAPAVARLLLALIALGAFGTVFLPQRPPHVPGRVETGLTGMACGLLTGFAGMPGPPVVPYYLGRAIPPQMARASMMLIFLATSLAGCASALVLRVTDWQALVLALGLFPAILIGNWLGSHAFGKVSAGMWRGFTAAVLAAAALAAVIKLL